MPFNSFTFAVAANDQAQDILTVEGGDLVSVMLGPEAPGSGNAEFYGQILLASTEVPNPIPIAILASGYFGASVLIGWTGSILMEPTYAILARVWSPSANPVRCTVATQEVR